MDRALSQRFLILLNVLLLRLKASWKASPYMIIALAFSESWRIQFVEQVSPVPQLYQKRLISYWLSWGVGLQATFSCYVTPIVQVFAQTWWSCRWSEAQQLGLDISDLTNCITGIQIPVHHTYEWLAVSFHVRLCQMIFLPVAHLDLLLSTEAAPSTGTTLPSHCSDRKALESWRRLLLVLGSAIRA
jgi:hypothetical protein